MTKITSILCITLSLLPYTLSFAKFECSYDGKHNVITNTQYGSLRGCSIPTMNSPLTLGKRINMWLGVPFAKTPKQFQDEYGNEWGLHFRFKKPERPGNWKSPYDATFYRPACPQMLWYIRETVPDFSDTSEDCLYLNIFAPNFTSIEHDRDTTLYPVMVFIHGGGFTMGSARQWPAMMIAERNVVVVTINYRLGPLGFLSTGDSQSPGNYGLWDQLAAMEFIKSDIHNFKGNPEKITLFGHSAGAASIGYHVLSPHTLASFTDPKKSMFQKVIYMSGSDLNDWSIIKEKWQMKEYAQELAGQLGCPTTSNYELVRCLQLNRKADDIVKAAAQIRVKEKRLGNPWAPVIDGKILSLRDAYITEDPATLRQQRHFRHIRVMGGVVKDEGSWFIPNLPNLPVGIYTNEFQNIIREFLEDQGSDNLMETLQALVFKYTYWPQPSNITMIRQMLTDLMSDYMFGAGIFDVLASHTHNRTYAYMFNYKSYNDYLPTWRGIAHGQELQYVFGFPYWNMTYSDLTGVYPRQRYTYGDNETSEIMISLFTNFSVYDNPTYLGKRNYRGIKWDQYNQINHTTLIIRNQSKSYMQLNYRQSYYAFWRHYYPRLSGRIKDGERKIKALNDESGTKYTIATYVLVALIVLLIIIIIIVLIRVCKTKGDDFNDSNGWNNKPYTSTTTI